MLSLPPGREWALASSSLVPVARHSLFHGMGGSCRAPRSPASPRPNWSVRGVGPHGEDGAPGRQDPRSLEAPRKVPQELRRGNGLGDLRSLPWAPVREMPTVQGPCWEAPGRQGERAPGGVRPGGQTPWSPGPVTLGGQQGLGDWASHPPP